MSIEYKCLPSRLNSTPFRLPPTWTMDACVNDSSLQVEMQGIEALYNCQWDIIDVWVTSIKILIEIS